MNELKFRPEWFRLGDGQCIPRHRGLWIWCREFNRACWATWDGERFLDKQDRTRLAVWWCLPALPTPPPGVHVSDPYPHH